MFRIVLSTYIFFTTIITFGQLPKNTLFKNKKVELIPVMYESPTNPLTMSGAKSNHIWVVYSDRNNNNIYSDITCTKVLSKANFLDSFYVTKVNGNMFELIKYNSEVVSISGQILVPDKIEYAGWINESNLLLNETSFIDPANKFPYKYVTLFNGNKVFPTTLNYLNDHTIKIFSDPELSTAYGHYFLKLNEVVYVFKQNKEQVLIGYESHFNSKNARYKIIGWVHTSFIQQWSSRLSVEVNLSENSDTIASYLFPAKNHAINFENNKLAAIPLKSNGCHTTENFWNKNPVYTIERISKNNENYQIMETGVIIKPFDNSQSYIYSATGSKINYANLCKISEESEKTNIIFALNFDSDIKEYYTQLIETFQELDQYFSIQKKGTYTFSLINTSDYSSTKITIVDNFSQLLPKVIDQIKENVQLKKSTPINGILNGLTSATVYLKNHIGENNIIISMSTQGDYNTDDNIYKNKLDKVISDLSNYNTKIIMYQPYSAYSAGYSNFIPQSKNILKKYADKSILIKRSLQITKRESVYSNNFKSIETGLSNIYCLDFPQNSISQGFIVFPTIESIMDKKTISKTLDSLFYQLNYDKTNTLNNIQSTFNSSSIFNTKVNSYFERYYNMFNILPRNLELECKNFNFDYFARGYTIYPYTPFDTKRYYIQNLLLSEEEYQELCSIFKSLRIDQLLLEPSETNKQVTENNLKNIFSNRMSITKRKYSQPTIQDFLYETCDYYSYTNLLNKCPINNLFDSPNITKDEYFTLLTRLKNNFDSFYQIQLNPNYSFYSNGIKYYWISETLLP